MDYYRIDLEPAPNDLLDGRDGLPLTAPSMRGEVFGDAYSDRLARYEADLDTALLRLRFGAMTARRYPEHAVILPGRMVTVVYDGDLDRRMLEVYVLHGWPGIDAVRDALRRQERGPQRALFPWRLALEFLDFTRSLMVAAVQVELIALEREATDVMLVRLNDGRNMAVDAWNALDVRPSTELERRVIRYKAGVDRAHHVPNLSYVLGNETLALQLLDVVASLVRAREELAELRARRDRSQAMLDDAYKVTRKPDVHLQGQVAQVAGQIDNLVSAVDRLYRDLHALCPIAVLTAPMLRSPVRMYAFTGAFVDVVRGFVDQAESIGRALSAESSWVSVVVPARRPILAGKRTDDDQGYPADLHPDLAVADAALEHGSDDHRYLSMLDVGILTDLIGRADGLGYVVRAQYVAVLLERLQDEEELRAALSTVFGVMAKVAAAISLVSLLTPLGWFTRAVAVALDVGAVAFQVHAAVGQFALYDRAVAQAMVELDRADVEKLTRLSELIQLRPELAAQLTAAVITEIGLIVTAGAWADFRRLLHLRGYYSDLETLFEV